MGTVLAIVTRVGEMSANALFPVMYVGSEFVVEYSRIGSSYKCEKLMAATACTRSYV